MSANPALINTTGEAIAEPSNLNPSAVWARALVLKRLERLLGGTLSLWEEGSSRTFGQPTDDGVEPLHVQLQIHDDRMWWRAISGGALGVAEAYMDGDWQCDDLTGLIRLMVRNQDILRGIDGGWGRLGQVAARLYHRTRRNTRQGSRRNIAAHYDLGNSFFERMLDSTMMYSAAVYPEENATLEQASRHKLDLLCRALDLKPSDKLLEIGTGWGGLALHAAKHYGCHVTTTTISREQFELAKQRVNEAGLEGQVELLCRDYRDLSGQYDKLVSVEMIEAVGAEYLDQFFGQCGRLLRPGGKMMLQAISMADQHYARALRQTDFIKRYIFPGSFIPSVAVDLVAISSTVHHWATTKRRHQYH